MFSKKVRYLTTTSLLALFVLAPVLAVAPVYAQSPTPATSLGQIPAAALMTSFKCPDCWAGYGDNATAGSVTMVTATVTMQAVTCASTNPNEQLVADIVAIDNGATDFLVVAATAYCAVGSSTPVYYLIETGSHGTFNGAPISAGDKVTMTVSVSAGTAHYSYKDSTAGTKGKDSGSASGAALQYATCFTDMFNNAGTPLPLAQFTKASFSKCDATIGGVTKAIGAFGSSILVKYTCVDSTSTITLAKPSSLSSDKSDFKVSWKAAGP